MNPELLAWLKEIVYHMEKGCCNRDCRIRKPGGQATNASCRCNSRVWKEELLNIAAQMEREL